MHRPALLVLVSFALLQASLVLGKPIQRRARQNSTKNSLPDGIEVIEDSLGYSPDGANVPQIPTTTPDTKLTQLPGCSVDVVNCVACPPDQPYCNSGLPKYY